MASKPSKRGRKKDSPRVIAELQNQKVIYSFSSSYHVGWITRCNKKHCWVKDELGRIQGTSLGLKIEWKNIYLIVSASANYDELLVDHKIDPVHGYLAWYDGNEYKMALSYDPKDHTMVLFDDDTEFIKLPNYVELNGIKQPSLIHALSAENTIIYQMLNKNKSLKGIDLSKYVIITDDEEADEPAEGNGYNENIQNDENEEKEEEEEREKEREKGYDIIIDDDLDDLAAAIRDDGDDGDDGDDDGNKHNEDKQNDDDLDQLDENIEYHDDEEKLDEEVEEVGNGLNHTQNTKKGRNNNKKQVKLSHFFPVKSSSKKPAAPRFKSTSKNATIPAKSLNFDKVNNKKVDKKEEIKLSKEEIDNLEGFEVKGYEIKVYNKDIKFVWNEEQNKYITLCRNHFLFTETRMDKFDEKYSDFNAMEDDESLYCCSKCNKWRRIILEKGEDLKFNGKNEEKLICGFHLNEKVFRGDLLTKHSASKNHKECKQNLYNYHLKSLDRNFEDIQNKIESGELPERLMAYFSVFCCVYFGVKHHQSLRSIIDLKADLAPLIINYFVEKIENKIHDKINYVFLALKKKIDRFEIDTKKKQQILKDINKASDELICYLKSMNIHEIPQKYKNTRDIKIMINSIADVIRFDVWSEASRSPIISPLIDESTSLSNDQRMILYFIFLINDDSAPEAVAKFIDIYDCDGTKAVDLMNSMEKGYVAINNFLSSYTEIKKCKKDKNKQNDIEKPRESSKDIINGTDPAKVTKYKTVFFGSDGPSVMQRLAELLKKHWNPLLIWLHCIGHRSALGSKDPNKDEELKKILNELDSEINAIQSYIKNSPKVKEQLQAFTENPDGISSKLHYVIRWLTKTEAYNNHLNAVPAIIKCFVSIAKLTNDDTLKAKLLGWVRKLVNFKNLHRQSIVADALSAVQPLRVKFQPDIADFEEIKDTLNDTLCDLESLNDNAGKQELRLLFDEDNQCEMLELKENNEATRNLWQSTAIYALRSHNDENLNKNIFIKDTNRAVQNYGQQILQQNKSFKSKLIKCTIKSYNERFSNLDEFDSFCIANPKCIKIYLSKHKMPAYIEKKGKNDIIKWLLKQSVLTNHVKALFDKFGNHYHLDWGKIKKYEMGPYLYLLYKNRDMDKRSFFTLRWKELKRDCYGCALITRHTLIAPWDACCCERGFSEQNMHITKYRNGILTDLLRDLMMICLEGPEFGTKEFLEVIIRSLKVWILNDRRY